MVRGMNETTEREYVLGTHDAELQRLGLQHRVWQSHVLAHWRRAGLRAGARVLDVGCGPGYASRDLAEIVGPAGRVVAVDLSDRYLDHARTLCAALPQAAFFPCDVMQDPLPAQGFDAVWCRWVLCFLPDPLKALRAMRAAVRPGARLISHEYADYRSWRVSPAEPDFEQFVQYVMANWRRHGGEPDIALHVPAVLADAGFRLLDLTPVQEVARPADPFWDWPDAFVTTGLDRLVDLGDITADFAARVHAAWARTAAHPQGRVITPLVWQITAEAI